MNLSIISRPANSDSLFALIPEAVLKDRNISSGVIFYRIVYGICYTALLFIISSLIFQRKVIGFEHPQREARWGVCRF